MRVASRCAVLLGVICLVCGSSWAAGDDFTGTWGVSGSGPVFTIDQAANVLKVQVQGPQGSRSYVIRADGSERSLATGKGTGRVLSAAWVDNALVIQTRSEVNERVVRRTTASISRVDADTLEVTINTFRGNKTYTRTLVLDQQ